MECKDIYDNMSQRVRLEWNNIMVATRNIYAIVRAVVAHKNRVRSYIVLNIVLSPMLSAFTRAPERLMMLTNVKCRSDYAADCAPLLSAGAVYR